MRNKMQTLCIVNIALVDDEQVSNANLSTKASRKTQLNLRVMLLWFFKLPAQRCPRIEKIVVILKLHKIEERDIGGE